MSLFSQYPLLYGLKWLAWSYKFGLMNIKWISDYSGTNFEFYGLKMAKFQHENHQNEPLEKQKCHFFSKYTLLYGLKWLVWSYKFGLMNIKWISDYSGTNFEFYGPKMGTFQHENHKNEPLEKIKRSLFLQYPLYCMAWNDLYDHISLVVNIKWILGLFNYKFPILWTENGNISANLHAADHI